MANNNILLINPNRLHHPPVVPLGIEYLVTPLIDAGYAVDVLDLCFVENWRRHIDDQFAQKKYLVTGLSLRNLDTVLYPNNQFFLPEIKEMVKHLHTLDTQVVLGGSGYSILPQEILKYTGADYGVIGPGEQAFPRLVEDIQSFDAKYQFVNGWQEDYRPTVPIRGDAFDYARYLKMGALPGLETQKGCTNTCPYCVEANRPVIYKDLDCVIEELRQLVKQHWYKFHLCDAEFNQKLEHCAAFAEKIIAAGFKLQWTFYAKPRPMTGDLVALLKRAGAHLVTLTVDTLQLDNDPAYSHLEQFILACQKNKIDVAVDALLGLPHEPVEASRKLVNFLKQIKPTTVGINTYTRIYKYTGIAGIIGREPALRKHLLGQTVNNPDFLLPIFYHHLDDKEVLSWTNNDPCFRIEGRDQAVNYQRIAGKT